MYKFANQNFASIIIFDRTGVILVKQDINLA